MRLTFRPGGIPAQSILIVAALLVAELLVLVPAAWGHSYSPNCQANPGTYPDVIVGDIYEKYRWGVLGDITAFSVGTKSCNTGTCWLNWIASTNDHPTITQNMYRLKNSRFEQIGQSWVKNGFTALQQSLCGTCVSSGSGSYLGVGCSDPYSASLNGSWTYLSSKAEVNPVTGDFPYPPVLQGCSNTVICRRLQVHNADLDPALNAGAQYFVDSGYVAWDDINSGGGKNNYSYRPLTVSGSGTTFDITLTGSTVREQSGIQAWKAADPTVSLVDVQVQGDGVFTVGVKVTELAPSLWHYEYAVMNLSSYRAASSFSCLSPHGATITNVGFHDVDYHSGDLQVGTDWTSSVQSDRVVWFTEPIDQNPNANALRWSTLYNFRFDANVGPATGAISMGLWRIGSPATVAIAALSPTVCNADGICGFGETCANCPVDCFHQGGGSGCCGNGTCEAGENPCRCTTDCGTPTASETACANSVDDDCDGYTDCADLDCCRGPSCAASDADGDGYGAGCDCNNNDGSVYPGAAQLCDGKNNDCRAPSWPTVPASEADADGDGVRICANDCDDGNSHVWSKPGEASGLAVGYDRATRTTYIAWGTPASPGGNVVHYDTLRSSVPSDFMGAVCVETDGSDRTTADPGGAPSPGLNAYLVRARNACPDGIGRLGTNSSGLPIPGRLCP